MAESAALLVDEVLPHAPIRQWVVSVPYPLQFLFACRIGRFLECRGLLEGDAENSYLAADALEEGPLDQLIGHSITYRIAMGPRQGRKVFTLQPLPARESAGCLHAQVAKVAGFSLHAGVATKNDNPRQ